MIVKNVKNYNSKIEICLEKTHNSRIDPLPYTKNGKTVVKLYFNLNESASQSQTFPKAILKKNYYQFVTTPNKTSHLIQNLGEKIQ